MKIDTKRFVFWAGLTLCVTSLANANTLVTFQVDMTQQIALGNFTPGANVVNARGFFNGWGTSALTNNPSGSNTNLYSGTFDNTADPNGGVMNYKYCIDSGGWESTTGCGGGGDNRTAGLPATSGASLVLPIVYFNNALPSLTPVTDNITFQVDMTQQIAVGNFQPGTSVVYVRGSYNGWAGTGTAMTNDPAASNTNLFSMTIAATDVPLNLQHFKYFIDTGNNWENPSDLNKDCTGNRFVNMLETNGDIILPPVYFADLPPAPPITNIVTFSVDMSVQAALGHFAAGTDTVECRGSFNNWNAGAFVLTNDAAAVTSNLYSGTLAIIVPPTSISYKFWDSNPAAGNNGYESPSSTGGGNRPYSLVNSNASLTIPTVYYADLTSTADFLTEDTLVTFTVSMTNAMTTGGIPFNPVTDRVYLNGDWIPWWAWGDPLEPYVPYELTNGPSGDQLYSGTFLIPKGNSLLLTYKFSINGADNELAPYVNHVRYVRYMGNYTMPLDTFGTPVTEPQLGAVTIGAPSGGYVPVSWVGLPSAYLQTATSVIGSWANHPETSAYGSSSGIYSTNYPMSGEAIYFRAVKP
jgi:hypothetical protein